MRLPIADCRLQITDCRMDKTQNRLRLAESLRLQNRFRSQYRFARSKGPSVPDNLCNLRNLWISPNPELSNESRTR